MFGFFKKKESVTVTGVVRRIGPVVRGGDNATVHYVMVLEGRDDVVTVWVKDCNWEPWRAIAGCLALTVPGDSISFVGTLDDANEYVIDQMFNHSFGKANTKVAEDTKC